MNNSNIDYTNKKDKWTIMKYVNSFDLLLEYVELIKRLKFQVDDKNIDAINKEMQEIGVYNPKRKASRDTTYFKIIQICNNMLAYRGSNQSIVFTPLCNLLLEHKDNLEHRGKIVATMWANLPYNHPYNKMSASFNIFPYRLLYKLLLDKRLHGKLYQDEVFYLVAWIKDIDDATYNQLVKNIIELRAVHYIDKLELFTHRLPVQDTLANMLHETDYLFGQLKGAGIVNIVDGISIGTLYHGGFGRGRIPETLEEIGEENYNPTGHRRYTNTYIELQPYMVEYIENLLSMFDYTEKPHSIYEELGTEDYILTLWNIYPQFLLQEIGVDINSRNRMGYISKLTSNIQYLAKNQEAGDCYKFEHLLKDAFNEFIDISADKIGGPGNTDIECIYLPIKEKFDVEAKSTSTKLSTISAGRLQAHRNKIGSKYTIIVTPNYVPSILLDIDNTDNVVLTVASLCNFIFQYSLKQTELSYKPLYDIVMKAKGKDISRMLDDYISKTFGISKSA